MKLPKILTAKRGMAATDAILSVVVICTLLFVGALIMQSLATSFESEFTGEEFEGTYNKTVENSITGFNLMTIVIILVAAGALIGAIYAFVR